MGWWGGQGVAIPAARVWRTGYIANGKVLATPFAGTRKLRRTPGGEVALGGRTRIWPCAGLRLLRCGFDDRAVGVAEPVGGEICLVPEGITDRRRADLRNPGDFVIGQFDGERAEGVS